MGKCARDCTQDTETCYRKFFWNNDIEEACEEFAEEEENKKLCAKTDCT